ncbi:FAD-dependent oxidoreductase [Thermococcus sp.]|uniref:FAD-dependent oxidoreductase n=1 Tax=Thermococcus sp. TaxID=35749 RepID=UPI003413F40F
MNGARIGFKKALIATGSRARVLPLRGLEEVRDGVFTHVEALSLKDLSDSVVVIGGRTQALEFAQIFARAGSRVVLLQRSLRIMPEAEPKLAIELKDILSEEVEIHTEALPEGLKRGENGVLIEATVGGRKRTFEAEYVFFATGRVPNTENLGLENPGVKTDGRGFIVVDTTMKAGKNVYAAGDMVGEPMLETVAAGEGFVTASNALGAGPVEMDYSVVPKVVFTDPQLASVGLTDREASKTRRCLCNTVEFSSVPKARIIGEERGLIKMVVDDETERILGVHILSHDAPEIVHEAAMVVKNRMTVEEVIETLHIFPTMSEAIKLAAFSFKEDVSKMPCCAL